MGFKYDDGLVRPNGDQDKQCAGSAGRRYRTTIGLITTPCNCAKAQLI